MYQSRWFFLFLLPGVLTGLTGCSDEPHPMGGHPTPSPMMEQPAARTDFMIPPAGFPVDSGLGRQLFTQHCVQCHGEAALGSEQGPPLIHRIYEPSHHADIAFYRAIALGVHQHHWEFGDMPPVPGVDGEQATHIIAWIRQEQRKVGIE